MNAAANRLVAGGETTTTEFVVDGLRCAACIAKLERGLAGSPGVAHARVNFTTRRVRVDYLPEIDPEAIEAAISRIGFITHRFAGEGDTAQRSETRRLALALAVAGFAAMNVMLLSVSIWSGATGATRDLFHWLSALIALPAIGYSGRPFLESAWRALRQGRTNMDVPISIGVALTTGMSLYETATGGAEAYFDGAVMLLFFLLTGRLLDAVMRARAVDGVAALLRLVPDTARVIGADGTIEHRRRDELAPGMRLHVAVGERFTVDGVVQSGTSSVDRSMITGESLPEAVAPGSAVLAGTVNLAAPLIVCARAVGASTGVAEIGRLMEAASQSRSVYVRVADRAARLYAPAVHLLAALSAAGWLIAGADLHQAAMIAIAVLIITCPCALGLAVPIAQVVATGALMRAGVLVTDGTALERLAGIDTVLLDKTGTVTLGHPEVTGGLPEASSERAALAALARLSTHPLSRAIAAAHADAAPVCELSDVIEVAGRGVSAQLGGSRVMLGQVEWVDPAMAPAGEQAQVAFRLGDGPVRVLTIADPLRPDAAAAIAAIRKLVPAVTILSGDAPAVVDGVARALGITGAARLDPAAKHAMVARHPRALMVGDGINDGPALRAASVAMAPSAASDVGRQAADIIFFGDALMPVPRAIRAARRTMAVVRQNFALAIGYNLLAVPLAMAGLVTPLIAAVAMSGSSLIVVANALRLRSAAR